MATFGALQSRAVSYFFKEATGTLIFFTTARPGEMNGEIQGIEGEQRTG